MSVLSVDWSDPRLDMYRKLSDAELLRSHGMFVAEGRLIVQRLIESGQYEIVSAVLNDASLAALGPLFDSRAPEVPLFRLGAKDFEPLTGFNLHRGCLALVRRPASLDWRAAAGDSRLLVVLEGVTNADNVGGVFRNAAAFGAGAVLLSPTCCDPLYRKAVRTSVGAVLSVPFARVTPWPDALGDLRDSGFCLAALTPRNAAATLAGFAASRRTPVALLVGSEGPGLTSEARRYAEVTVGIPMRAEIDSLNLVVATAIALSTLSGDGSAS